MKLPRKIETFLENRIFLPGSTTPQISNQIDAADAIMGGLVFMYEFMHVCINVCIALHTYGGVHACMCVCLANDFINVKTETE